MSICYGSPRFAVSTIISPGVNSFGFLPYLNFFDPRSVLANKLTGGEFISGGEFIANEHSKVTFGAYPLAHNQVV